MYTFDIKDLKNLWYQYTVIFPFLCSSGTTGLDFKQFSQFVGGTFSEWYISLTFVSLLFLTQKIGG